MFCGLDGVQPDSGASAKGTCCWRPYLPLMASGADGLLPIKRGIHSRRLHCADAERLLMTHPGIENSVAERAKPLISAIPSSMFPSPLSERLPPARLQQHIDGLPDQRLNLHPRLTGPTFIERELVECPR
jgi:hypothetical protein